MPRPLFPFIFEEKKKKSEHEISLANLPPHKRVAVRLYIGCSLETKCTAYTSLVRPLLRVRISSVGTLLTEGHTK